MLLRCEHSSRTFPRIHGVVGEVLGDLDVAVVKVRLLLLDIADGSKVEHTGVFFTEGKVGQTLECNFFVVAAVEGQAHAHSVPIFS